MVASSVRQFNEASVESDLTANELPAIAPNYVRATKRWPDATLIRAQYESLEGAYSRGECSIPEHVKGYVECVCRTILQEYGKSLPESNPPFGQVLSAALKVVGLQNTRDGSSTSAIATCYNKLGEALNAARNDVGAVAHGRDGFLDALSANHMRTMLLAGDSVVGILLDALDGIQPDIRFTREPYERFGHLNGRIDRMVTPIVDLDESDGTIVVTLEMPGSLENLDMRVAPSELLYNLDRTAYLAVLESATDYLGELAEETEPQIAPKKRVDTDAEPVSSRRNDPHMVETSSYSGRLDTLRPGLEILVTDLSCMAPFGGAADNGLPDSIMATTDSNADLDWQRSESGHAKVRVALKRLMTAVGAGESASTWSDMLSDWLVANWDEAI